MHRHHLIKTIKNENEFERSRGIITCVPKSVITPIQQKIKDNVLALRQFGETLEYPYLKGKTKILGLKISSTSFTASHIETISQKAGNIVSMC